MKTLCPNCERKTEVEHIFTVRRYEDGALQGEGQDAALKRVMEMG